MKFSSALPVFALTGLIGASYGHAASGSDAPAPAPVLTLTDLRDGRPWLPEKPAVITPEMAEKMRAFTKMFGFGSTRPSGKGIAAGTAEALAKRVAALGLHRDAAGKVVEGLPIFWNGDFGPPKGSPKNAIDFKDVVAPLMIDLGAAYYRTKAGSPDAKQLEEQIRITLEWFAARNWNPTRKDSQWVGNAYWLRRLAPVRAFTTLAHLLPDPAQRAQIAENAWWMLDGSIALEKSPAWSTDGLLNTVPQAFGGVAMLPDGPEKYQRILTLRRALDSSMLWNDYNLVTPDGAVIHHGAHHDHYAHYSFVPLAGMYERFERCGIGSENSAEVNRRLRLAAIAWAWSTLGTWVTPNMQQRVELPYATDKPERLAGRVDFLVATAKVAEASGGLPLEKDREFAGLILALDPSKVSEATREAWKKEGFTAVPPVGDLSLPSDGVVIHRRPGWMVVLRGQNKILRGAEGVGVGYRYTQWGQRSTYAGRFCEGSIFIADSGEPLSSGPSGWIADGFDYSRVPGTTGAVGRETNLMMSYAGTGAKLGGGCSLDGQGLWVFANGNQRKSAFLVDDRITFVTAGVGPAAKSKVTTTVFQSAENATLPMEVDGKPAPAEGALTLAGNSAHTLLDGRSRGYYLHAGGDSLNLTRGDQSWTYCEARWFDPAADAGIGVLDAGARTIVFRKKLGSPTANQINRNKAQFEGPEKLRYFKPSVHRYSTLGYTHGATTAPDRADIFTLLPKCDAGRLDGFAAAMKSATPPVTVKTSPAAHTFRDAATGFSGTCLFIGGAIPPDRIMGAVTAVSRPGTILEHRVDAGTLRLAVGSTDIDDKTPFVIRLKGVWTGAKLDRDMKLARDGADTVLTVPYLDMLGRIAELRSE